MQEVCNLVLWAIDAKRLEGELIQRLEIDFSERVIRARTGVVDERLEGVLVDDNLIDWILTRQLSRRSLKETD